VTQSAQDTFCHRNSGLTSPSPEGAAKIGSLNEDRDQPPAPDPGAIHPGSPRIRLPGRIACQSGDDLATILFAPGIGRFTRANQTTDARQIALVFLAWMEKHPDKAKDSCNLALFSALLDAKLAGMEPTGTPASESPAQ